MLVIFIDWTFDLLMICMVKAVKKYDWKDWFLNKISKMFAGKWKLIETEGRENFLKVEIKINYKYFIFAVMLNKL